MNECDEKLLKAGTVGLSLSIQTEQRLCCRRGQVCPHPPRWRRNRLVNSISQPLALESCHLHRPIVRPCFPWHDSRLGSDGSGVQLARHVAFEAREANRPLHQDTHPVTTKFLFALLLHCFSPELHLFCALVVDIYGYIYIFLICKILLLGFAEECLI